MIKGLLFDFYGTIGIYNNLEFADKQTLNIIGEYLENRCEFDDEELKLKWSQIFSRTFDINQIGEVSIFMHKLKELYRTFDLYVSDEELYNIAERCLNEWHTHISLPIDIHKTLDELSKRYKLAIISNFDHSSALRNLLNQNSLVSYFDYIAISGELGYNKPNKVIFEKVLKELELNSEEAIFIGDSIVDDIDGSNNAGIKNILIDMTNKYDNYKDFKIKKLSELLESKIIDNYNLARMIKE